MTAQFKLTYDEHDEFYALVDLLRPVFGQWDAYDPVARALLDVIEAQSDIAELFEYDPDNEVAFRTVVDKRHAAIKSLLRVAEDRESWPDPKMGQRS